MQQLEQFLKRWPALYVILRRFYLLFALRWISLRGYLNRNGMSELWATKHLREGDDSTDLSCISRNHPQRFFLIDHIASLAPPISNILEIGCGTGPNLYLLAQKFPDGGRYFSGYCRRYYTFVIIEGLRPVLGSVYPFLRIIKQVIYKK